MLSYLQRPAGRRRGPAVAEDLMRFCRARFRRYADTLAGLRGRARLDSVPLLINIHGTGGGRGLTYPIGISQLLGTWRNRPGLIAGSDMYLGDLTVGNVADFVFGNLFGAATAGPNQPLTALEFEAGDGDYGQDLCVVGAAGGHALKTRLAHALGNRLINFYLFAGGSTRRWTVRTPVAGTRRRTGSTGSLSPARNTASRPRSARPAGRTVPSTSWPR